MCNILKQYHYLYKITNLINNKIYIGIHSTDDLNDGYFGSGKQILQSIKKYGKDNFKKEILEWFDWKCEALQREEQIVNEDFIERPDVYNLIVGGGISGGFQGKKHKEHTKELMKSSWVKRRMLPISDKTKLKRSIALKGKRSGINNPMFGKKQTLESKAKCKQTKSINSSDCSNNIKCKIDNTIFSSITEASNKLGINRLTIQSRLRSNSLKFKNYLYI